MILAVLIGVLVLVVAGCGCVVWAARGGPGWVRGIAIATLGAGELVRRIETKQKRGSDDSSSYGS